MEIGYCRGNSYVFDKERQKATLLLHFVQAVGTTHY